MSGDREDARNIEKVQRRNDELEDELRRLKDILLPLEDDLGSSPLMRSSMCWCGPVSYRSEQGSRFLDMLRSSSDEFATLLFPVATSEYPRLGFTHF